MVSKFRQNCILWILAPGPLLKRPNQPLILLLIEFECDSSRPVLYKSTFSQVVVLDRRPRFSHHFKELRTVGKSEIPAETSAAFFECHLDTQRDLGEARHHLSHFPIVHLEANEKRNTG